jgi:hypothetical protein
MFSLFVVDPAGLDGVDVWCACWGGVEIFFEAPVGVGLFVLFGLAVECFELEGVVL